MVDPSVTIRVKADIKAEIQRLVTTGEFRSISDYIDKSIREKLERDNARLHNIDELFVQLQDLQRRVERLENK